MLLWANRLGALKLFGAGVLTEPIRPETPAHPSNPRLTKKVTGRGLGSAEPTTPGGPSLFGRRSVFHLPPTPEADLGITGAAWRSLERLVTVTIWQCDTLEGRHPRLLSRFSDVLLLRFADRALAAVLLKLPPRLTRLRALFDPLPDMDLII